MVRGRADQVTQRRLGAGLTERDPSLTVSGSTRIASQTAGGKVDRIDFGGTAPVLRLAWGIGHTQQCGAAAQPVREPSS